MFRSGSRRAGGAAGGAYEPLVGDARAVNYGMAGDETRTQRAKRAGKAGLTQAAKGELPVTISVASTVFFFAITQLAKVGWPFVAALVAKILEEDGPAYVDSLGGVKALENMLAPGAAEQAGYETLQRWALPLFLVSLAAFVGQLVAAWVRGQRNTPVHHARHDVVVEGYDRVDEVLKMVLVTVMFALMAMSYDAAASMAADIHSLEASQNASSYGIDPNLPEGLSDMLLKGAIYNDAASRNHVGQGWLYAGAASSGFVLLARYLRSAFNLDHQQAARRHDAQHLDLNGEGDAGDAAIVMDGAPVFGGHADGAGVAVGYGPSGYENPAYVHGGASGDAVVEVPGPDGSGAAGAAPAGAARRGNVFSSASQRVRSWFSGVTTSSASASPAQVVGSEGADGGYLDTGGNLPPERDADGGYLGVGGDEPPADAQAHDNASDDQGEGDDRGAVHSASAAPVDGEGDLRASGDYTALPRGSDAGDQSGEENPDGYMAVDGGGAEAEAAAAVDPDAMVVDAPAGRGAADEDPEVVQMYATGGPDLFAQGAAAQAAEEASDARMLSPTLSQARDE